MLTTIRHYASAMLLFIAAFFIMNAGAAAATKNYQAIAPDGVTIAIQESGNPEGQPIVFIHGLLGSHLNWEKQVNSPELQQYRLITYDLRGHGLSGKPTDATSYTDGTRWAGDLATVIAASNTVRPVLVGWSLGGVVISNYLAKFGDSPISGAVYVDGVIELKPDQIVPHPQVYRLLNSADLKTHLDAVKQFLSLCFHIQPDRATFERLLANAALASWEMQRFVQQISVPVVKGLGSARVPVLMLYGQRDELVNTQATIARAKEINPRVRTRLYANSGHAPFVEEPERFNHDLADFIRSLEKR